MGERIFSGVILLFTLTLILSGWLYFEYSWKLLRFPFGVGAAIVLLCLVELVVARRETEAEPDDELDTEAAGEACLAPRDAIRGIIWVMVAFPTVYLLGYVIGLPLYIFAAVRLRGHGWGISVATALGGLVVVYFGFMVGLGVPLPLLPFEL